jgi:hypothetical protein
LSGHGLLLAERKRYSQAVNLKNNGGKIAFDGPEASKVIRCLLNCIDSSFAEQCSDNIEVSSDKCQCTRVEMEGVKLDIVILEAKFNKQSDALEKLHNEMASLISKLKGCIPVTRFS